jgi:hypothetical protein
VGSSERKIRSPKELAILLKDLDSEIEEILNAEGVFPVSSHGWIDHDTEDPEYAGHAMWQTDPPFQHDFSTLLGGGVVQYAPTLRDEVLTRSGDDFEAVMISARRSIGMALARARTIQSLAQDHSEKFWQDYSTCMMLLAIASDRIRDFAVMALENEEYDSKKGEKAQEALVKGAIAKVPGLADLAKQSQAFKELRNKVVHKIATRAALRSVDILEEQRGHAISGKPVEIWEPTFEELQASTSGQGDGASAIAAVEETRSWYECLIKASNLIFKAEHSLRQRAKAGS